MEAVWIAVFLVVAATGLGIAAGRRSRSWTAAGIAFALGGAGIAFYNAFLPDPPVGTMTDVASWAAVLGFLCLVIACIFTLVAVGSGGRRRFLVVLAASTLVVGTYQFWSTNWAVRFGDPQTQCFDKGHLGPPGGIQRIPPGVHCRDDTAVAHSGTVPMKTVFVPADGISWLALGGLSLYYAIALSFPLMGLAWVVRRRSSFAGRFGLTG